VSDWKRLALAAVYVLLWGIITAVRVQYLTDRNPAWWLLLAGSMFCALRAGWVLACKSKTDGSP
jgi:hypothetical protein